MTQLLRTGGRYITAGAIAGPIVELDVRDLYLKDLTLEGSTYQDPEVFPNLVGYIERGEIRPVVAATYPLADIVEAQHAFLEKSSSGRSCWCIPSEPSHRDARRPNGRPHPVPHPREPKRRSRGSPPSRPG